MHEAAQSPATTDALVAQVATLQAALAAERAALAESRTQVDQLSRENEQLRASHERLRQQLELLRRRIFIAKAERVDSSQLELEFATKLAAYDALSGQLANGSAPATGTGTSPNTSAASKGCRRSSGVRRNRSRWLRSIRTQKLGHFRIFTSIKPAPRTIGVVPLHVIASNLVHGRTAERSKAGLF
jgi:transposase